MSVLRKQFDDFKGRTESIADAELDDFWASLEPATIDGMIGEWKGGEFVTGHKMVGRLAKMGWFGKTFKSAADVYGDRTLAVVLTGMGSDGTQGAAWIKAQGGRVFTEAEETCVVYGMPRSVVEAGLSDRSVPLDRMAEAILGAL